MEKVVKATMRSFYKNKNVLVTGHTGFKGSWLSIMLIELGANVIGYSLEPRTERDNFVLTGLKDKIIDIRGDIRDNQALYEAFTKYNPDIVFHLAAQPLVRYSYRNPKETYEVNVMGTINLLECIKQTESVREAVIITTDKCYENKGQIWGYRENDMLGGYDPYSSSKACVEILVSSYRNSFFNICKYNEHGKAVSTVRAGNVIGGGDWSEDRLIPDCIKAIENNRPIEIRSPSAVRPWQYVLEPLKGYLMLAQKMRENPSSYSQAWNFGPNIESVKPVWNICKLLIEKYGCGELIDVSNNDNPHEANLLSLDITKSIVNLGWKPMLSIEKALDMTVEWYKRYKEHNVYEICVKQIKEYEVKLNEIYGDEPQRSLFNRHRTD